jgi:cellobiose phosphorylase
MWPPYTSYDPALGSISAYPPGRKENNGIFVHAHSWTIPAAALLGLGDEAFEQFMQANPIVQDTSTYKVEPYAYCQNIAVDDGEGANSWLTGGAAWHVIGAEEYILGINYGYDGVRINPCIPKDWKNFNVTAKYREATYNIGVNNPNGVCRGIKEVRVDGAKIPPSLDFMDKLQYVLPIFGDGKTHKVEVLMGR